MARFDEEANINWASRLEEVGAHVVYGVVGHKTHAKLTLLLRREAGVLRRYAHLGTGNYPPRTARLYEDFGMFTADPDICADVHEVFRRLTGTGQASDLRCLLQAPFTLAAHVLSAIKREADAARAGRRAYIAAKVNALLEPAVIEAQGDVDVSLGSLGGDPAAGDELWQGSLERLLRHARDLAKFCVRGLDGVPDEVKRVEPRSEMVRAPRERGIETRGVCPPKAKLSGLVVIKEAFGNGCRKAWWSGHAPDRPERQSDVK
jgi:hypothetical protein